MLRYLVEKRCLRVDRAKRYEAILRDLQGKELDVDAILHSLLGTYVAKTKKGSKIHYYVDPGRAMRALRDHSLWEPGHVHPHRSES